MNSPHLPSSPHRFRFKIRPVHITLAVIAAIHVVAFFLFFNNGEPGGSSEASSGDLSAETAKISWQHIDALVPSVEEPEPEPEAVVVVAPAPAPEVAPVPEVTPPPSTPEVVAITAAPEAPAVSEAPVPSDAIPIPIPASSPPPPAERPMPIRVATVVGEPGGRAVIPTGGTGTGFGEGSNAGFDFGAYDLLITREFHKAWVQPLGVDTPFRRNVAKLSVKIRRDGKVERFTLDRLTGVPELDSSVLAAARGVRRIAPLPEDYHGDSYDVTINFRLD